MKIENFKCFSLTKKEKFIPEGLIKGRLERVDFVLKIFKTIKPEDLNNYVSNLTEKFREAVGNYEFNVDAFNWDSMRKGLKVLPNYPDLEKLVFLFVCKTINLPENYTHEKGEIESNYFNQRKAGERTSYYLVRNLADIYGKEEGSELYKQIAPKLIQEYISKAEAAKPKDKVEEPEDPKTIKIYDFKKRSTEAWCKTGLADFASCIINDYKVVYRFDSCLTPEALKEFNDPDIAYLASCYLADIPEFNEGRTIHLRRTQTLHHAPFCDEFYWNNYVHPDAEHPDIEFIENMGKDLEE
jgi:hypothetical protein